MKLSITLVSLLLSAVSASAFFGGQVAITDKKPVPGNSPLTYCENYVDDGILKIDHVDLTPNPPVKGENLTLEAVGTFSEPVEKGAKVRLLVKYGYVKIFNREEDLCDQVGNVDLSCPLDGKNTVTKIIQLPKEIPPGKYDVQADVYTKDEKKIICLAAEVTFP
ncbi:MAG: Phosphatidylglycerol/phosphatidylinositol transfer protein [Vezdaea acicularis]|nr:MAG: Phosphatidylglycerol/phosphatidylinositol transfer protein [Vezdaea acicularis]